MANSARTQPGAEKISSTDDSGKALENLQATYEKNKKPLNTIVTIVVVVIAGFLVYTKLYKAPRDEKAATAMSFAQRYFQVDSLDRALNGDGQHAGFLKVTKTYDGTKSANLAHYYAGICYLRMGDMNNAIKHLKEFDGNGTMVSYLAWGALGDAYMETGKTKDGIDYYNKATGDKDNSLITPRYLYRLGIAYEKNNQNDDARKAFMRIRDEYPRSMEARDADKYLARLGVLD